MELAYDVMYCLSPSTALQTLQQETGVCLIGGGGGGGGGGGQVFCGTENSGSFKQCAGLSSEVGGVVSLLWIWLCGFHQATF